MDSKNRLAIAVSITCLIVIAIFASFGHSLFLVRIPSVTLADMESPTNSSDSIGETTVSNQYWQVDVTPKTVQAILSTLSRPESYYRELMVEILWSGGASSTMVQLWQDAGWSHTRQMLPTGSIRHDLTGADMVYSWYEGVSGWSAFPADGDSTDRTQRIPTYETLLELDPSFITKTGYELRGSYPCVYVEVQSPSHPETVERYWVSTDSGLLVSAEREHYGQLVYRMTAYTPIQTPCPPTISFSLPDGTVFHTP